MAGVFTQSACASSEVELGRKSVRQGRARALVVNAGNSKRLYRLSRTRGGGGHSGPGERCTGMRGRGGIRLLDRSYRRAAAEGTRRAPAWQAALAAKALRMGKKRPMRSATTDTFPQAAQGPAQWSAKHGWNWPGSSKAAGMIAPHMATMLGYVFTDARCCARLSAGSTRTAPTAASFSCITVDGDTSTATPCWFRYRQGGQCPESQAGRAPAGGCLMPAAKLEGRLLPGNLAQCSWCANGRGWGRRKIPSPFSHKRVGQRSDHKSRATMRPCDRKFAAGEDRDCRRGRELGAAWSWPWAQGGAKPADRDKLFSIAFGGIWEPAREGLPVEDYDEAPFFFFVVVVCRASQGRGNRHRGRNSASVK